MLCNESQKNLSKLPDNHNGLVCQKYAKAVSFVVIFHHVLLKVLLSSQISMLFSLASPELI